jgi:hypothetical protein
MTRSYSDRQRTLKWVLPTTLRVYGLRPSGKTKGSTAFFLKASLSTDCVLLESQLANGLRPSCAQASCKECASLRQAARSALRSDKLQGVRFAQPVGKVVLMRSDAKMWQQVSFHAC